jgi:hypothetical protein
MSERILKQFPDYAIKDKGRVMEERYPNHTQYYQYFQLVLKTHKCKHTDTTTSFMGGSEYETTCNRCNEKVYN